ncbi:MAG: hypothetical protein ACLTYN_04610 [Dysosmobacter welbionis]
MNIAVAAPQGQPPGRHRRAGARPGAGRHREVEHRGHAGDRGGPAPRGVFLAAGAPPVVPKSIPGIDKAVLAEDVILGKAPCTGKVVLVGTGLTGLECAEMILAGPQPRHGGR